jgi:hypothetical protein
VKERRLAQLDEAIEVRCRSDVLVVPEITDSTVFLFEASANLLRAIGRRVVGDDDREFLQALRQQRVQRLSQVLFAVIDRNPNRHYSHASRSFQYQIRLRTHMNRMPIAGPIHAKSGVDSEIGANAQKG